MGLSKQGMRVLGFFERAARMGMSGRSLLSKLRKYGMGYRTQTFYRDYRMIKEAIKPWENMKYIRKDMFLPQKWYVKTSSPLATNYQTVVEFRAWHTTEQRWVTRTVTVAHDRRMKRKNIEARAAEIALETSPDIELYDAKPIRALQSPVKWV